ncbi:hypothetical protein BDN70DRAFT_271162 [Pholiota conissans]|uniref:Uncharacterized protein n=1 Tax=Pholiota conissans TaxID=109636 RepID=A0A9P5YT94_9AGAR|nr:hypothetical protein BDN70DRAFT_271162 [Pholiota conissans]
MPRVRPRHASHDPSPSPSSSHLRPRTHLFGSSISEPHPLRSHHYPHLSLSIPSTSLLAPSSLSRHPLVITLAQSRPRPRPHPPPTSTHIPPSFTLPYSSLHRIPHTFNHR